MEFRVLGPMEVLEGEHRVDIGPRRPRALLASLLIEANRVVSQDRLIDQLWGGAPPANATAALQVYISNLRRVLEPNRGRGAAPRMLVTRAPGYVLQVDADAVDAVRFEALVADGRTRLAAGEATAARDALHRALSLWRGEPYADLSFEASVSLEAARLVELRAGAAELVMEAELETGGHASVVAELEHLVAEEPLRERRWELLALALYRDGRQADALRAIDKARHTLGEELGLDPRASLRQLEHDILQQAPSLDWQPPAHEPRPPPLARQPLEAPPEQDSPVRASASNASELDSPAAAPPGTATPAREGEQKHVTVLFAEVDGLIGLSDRLDPEAVHDMVDGCFRIVVHEVERYGGIVNSFTGDGLMALFGVPVAHEDDAVRASCAAWAIQEALADSEALRLRIGLNTGPVVVGKVTGAPVDFSAVGGTVNLAAALRQAAPSGVTLAGEATYRAAGAALHWRHGSRVQLRGVPEPVSAYELLGLGPARHRFDVAALRGFTRFVGRDTELAQLTAAWERARAGDGQVVSVVGEAGLGKSRLIHEFKQYLTQDRTPVHEGACIAYGEVTPYLPFLDVVRSVFGLGAATPLGVAEKAVDDQLAARGIADDTALFLHLLLGHPVPEERLDRLAPNVVRQRTVEAIRRVVLAEAAATPLVLIIEDVHWVDSASEDALAELVEATASAALLVVLVYRPEYLHAWRDKAYHTDITLGRLGGASTTTMVRAILAKPFSQRVDLDRLSAQQSRAIVQDVLGVGEVPPALDDLIVNQTEGNPLFVEELTRSLLESGELVREGDRYVMVRPAAVVVPTSIQGVLVERFDRLAPQLKSLLQMTSVLGRSFSYAVLRTMADDRDDLDSQLLELEDLDFVYLTRLAPEREYSFKHVLTQQAVYDTLLRSRREAHHQRAGRGIEAVYAGRLESHYERLAHHYSRSPDTEKALDYLDLASRKAMRSNAMLEAKSYFDEAMQLLDRLPDTPANRHRRVSLLAHQFFVFWLLFRIPEYLELAQRYEPQAQEVDDPQILGAFYCNIAYCHWIPGDFDAFLGMAEKVLEISERAGNPAGAGLGRASMLMEWYHLSVGDYDEMVAWQPKAIAACQRDLDITSYIWAHTGAAIGYSHQGRWEEAARDCDAALRVGREYGDEGAVSRASFILSMMYTAKGEIDRAIEHGEQAVGTAPTPADRSFGETQLAAAWCRAGEPVRAAEVLAGLVPLFEAVQFRMAQCLSLVALGEAYWGSGEADKARETLNCLLRVAGGCGMRYWLGAGQRLLGEVERDASYFERSIALLGSIGAESELARAYAGYGRLCAQEGADDAARRHLARAREICGRLGISGL